jgi:hypothetical protein
MESDILILERKSQKQTNHSELLEFPETIILKNFSDDNLQFVTKN